MVEVRILDMRILEILTNAITVALVLITCYFLYQEMILFLSIPTHTSKFGEKIGPSHFPDITICSDPSYDQVELKRHGYFDSRDFMRGVFDRKAKVPSQLGWSGNGSSTPEKVTGDVSIFKSLQNCSDLINFAAIMKMPGKESLQKVEVKFRLTRPVSQNSQCCQVVTPDEAQTGSLVEIKTFLRPLIFNFQIFLSNRESAYFMFRHKFNILGEKILSQYSSNGTSTVTSYNVKIIEENNLESDPKVNCKNYDSDDGYAQCLDDLYLKQSLDMLGCTPPIISSDSSLQCKGLINVNETQFNFVEQFFLGINKKGHCLTPCKSARLPTDQTSAFNVIFI